MKYEYCQVQVKEEYDKTLKRNFITGPVQALTFIEEFERRNVIAEASTYLSVFNILGDEGWHLVASDQGVKNTIYYFERVK